MRARVEYPPASTIRSIAVQWSAAVLFGVAALLPANVLAAKSEKEATYYRLEFPETRPKSVRKLGLRSAAYDGEEDDVDPCVWEDAPAGDRIGCVLPPKPEGQTLKFSLAVVDEDGEKIPASTEVHIEFETHPVTATAGVDYMEESGTLVIPEGDSESNTAHVDYLQDEVDEFTETYVMSFEVTQGTQSTFEYDHLLFAIGDDDPLARLVVDKPVAREGAEDLNFEIRLVGATEKEVSADYTTLDDRVDGEQAATEGQDYVGAAGSITLAPGQTERTVSVTVLDDDAIELDETVVLEFSGTENAMVPGDRNDEEDVEDRNGAFTVVGTIEDDERVRTVRVLLFESDGHPLRQGFLRMVNHSSVGGTVEIAVSDDGGVEYDPIHLSIGPDEARHFNSRDLENGNEEKGLSGGVGPPSVGEWTMTLSTQLNIEALAYSRTWEGFVTSMHDSAPSPEGTRQLEHRVVFFNPGHNTNQVSSLRLINITENDAEATIRGTDDTGKTFGAVTVFVPAGGVRTLTAEELETGRAEGILSGSMGEGTGKWRLVIRSTQPLAAKSLLSSVGLLTNLSTSPGTPGGRHSLPLFPAAARPNWQGFVRVVNNSAVAGEVSITAWDDTGLEYGPIRMSIGAEAARHFNSDDLELGNAGKGLSGSTGVGTGDWRLDLVSELELEVTSYVRTQDGFLTAMHDVAPIVDDYHRIVFFNPASNGRQRSRLRLTNPGDRDARVKIHAKDDEGKSPSAAVRMIVPARQSFEVTSVELESGVSDRIESGALGDGKGKWRLRVETDQPIQVMSLLESPTGHLTNLSTELAQTEAEDR